MGTKCHFDSLEDVNLCYAVCDKKNLMFEFPQAFPLNLTNGNPCMRVVLTVLSKLAHADFIDLGCTSREYEQRWTNDHDCVVVLEQLS